jgi:large subunit ribosomal protein L25
MGEAKLAVEAREGRGKGVARRLRMKGMAPGVVYGAGREATPIALEVAQFERLLETSHGGINTLIDLEGSSTASGRTVIAKELQREPIRGSLLHVDFYEVNLREKIEVSVPVHLDGTAQGVVLGGVLDQQLREVDLLCLPGAIPDDLRTDVSHLQLGDSLHVSELVLPEGVEILTDPELPVATVLIPRGLRDAEEASEEEAGASGGAKPKAEEGSGD